MNLGDHQFVQLLVEFLIRRLMNIGWTSGPNSSVRRPPIYRGRRMVGWDGWNGFDGRPQNHILSLVWNSSRGRVSPSV